MMRAYGWMLLCLAAALVASPAAAVRQPGTFLVFSRFQIDEGYSSQVRVTNLHPDERVDVAVTFVCAGDEGGFCESLTVNVSLDPRETRVLDPGALNLGCGQGFAVAVAMEESGALRHFDYLIGSYEVSIKGKGKRREADIAVAFSSEEISPLAGQPLLDLANGVDRGQRLWSDFRSTSVPDRKGVRRQGSYLNLVDLSIVAGAQNDESRATVDWWTEDGETGFSVTYRFTCFGRIRLDELNVNLLEEHHGASTGWLRVRARDNAILSGSISEFGKGSATVRNMFERDVDTNLAGRRARR